MPDDSKQELYNGKKKKKDCKKNIKKSKLKQNNKIGKI